MDVARAVVLEVNVYGTECDIHIDLDSNEYPNILVKYWYELTSENVRKILIRTNIQIYRKSVWMNIQMSYFCMENKL